MAQGTEADSLFVALGLDMSELEEGIDGALGQVEQFGKELQKTGKTLTKNVTAPIAAAAASIGVLIKTSADFADQIDKTSQRTGVGAEELQRLRFAAEQSGSSMQAIARTTDSLVRRIPQIEDGTGRAAEAFGQLGVNLRNASGEMRDQGALYTDVLRSLADMENATQRNAVGTQLFGRQFRELIPLMNQGSSGIDALRERADELGIVMGEDDVSAFVDFKDAMHEVTESLADVGRELASAFLPVAEGLVPIFHGIIDVLGAVVSWFADLSTGVKVAISAVAGIVAIIPPLLVGLGTLATLLSGLPAAWAAISTAATAAWSAIFSPVTAVVAAIAAVAGGAYLIYQNWEGVDRFFSRLWTDVQGVFTTAMDLLVEIVKDMWPRAQKFFLEGLQGLIGPLADFARWLGAEGLADSIEGFQGQLGELVPNEAIRESSQRIGYLTDELKRGLSDTAGTVGETGRAIVDNIREMIGGVRGAVSGFFGGGGEFGGGGASGEFGGSRESRQAGLQGVTPTLQVGSFRSVGERIRDELEEATGVGVAEFGLQGLDGLSEKADEVREKLRGLAGTIRDYVSVQATRFVEDFSFGVGDIIGDLIIWQDEIKSIGDAFVAFGDVAKDALQRLIADLTTAVMRALALKALASAFGIGGGGSFVSLVGQGLGIGGKSMAAVNGAASLAAGGGSAVAAPVPVGQGGTQAVQVQLVPSVTPSGDILFAQEEGQRRRNRGSAR